MFKFIFNDYLPKVSFNFYYLKQFFVKITFRFDYLFNNLFISFLIALITFIIVLFSNFFHLKKFYIFHYFHLIYTLFYFVLSINFNYIISIN